MTLRLYNTGGAEESESDFLKMLSRFLGRIFMALLAVERHYRKLWEREMSSDVEQSCLIRYKQCSTTGCDTHAQMQHVL